MTEEVNFDDFLKVDLRIGTILEVNDFPKARKPAYQLKIDFGPSGHQKIECPNHRLVHQRRITAQTSCCDHQLQTETNCQFHERVFGL